MTNSTDGKVNNSFTTGGPLSSGNTNNQLEDATMRSQFNEVGASPYHLVLGAPTVLPAQTISVPKQQGSAFATPVGPLGLVAADWFAPKLNELMNKLHLDPATLPIFLVDNTYLYKGNDPDADGACCVLGFHGAAKPQGSGAGATSSNGNAPIQTFIFASYITRGSFKAPAQSLAPLGGHRVDQLQQALALGARDRHELAAAGAATLAARDGLILFRGRDHGVHQSLQRRHDLARRHLGTWNGDRMHHFQVADGEPQSGGKRAGIGHESRSPRCGLGRRAHATRTALWQASATSVAHS